LPISLFPNLQSIHSKHDGNTLILRAEVNPAIRLFIPVTVGIDVCIKGMIAFLLYNHARGDDFELFHDEVQLAQRRGSELLVDSGVQELSYC
jgi:hypothetical protein